MSSGEDMVPDCMSSERRGGGDRGQKRWVLGGGAIQHKLTRTMEHENAQQKQQQQQQQQQQRMREGRGDSGSLTEQSRAGRKFTNGSAVPKFETAGRLCLGEGMSGQDRRPAKEEQEEEQRRRRRRRRRRRKG
jgi:hypothetical protein